MAVRKKDGEMLWLLALFAERCWEIPVSLKRE